MRKPNGYGSIEKTKWQPAAALRICRDAGRQATTD